MKSILYPVLCFCFLQNISASPLKVVLDTLPYYEIPNYPEQYTPETVVIRMIDGVGFRFHWATEGLTAKDLAFKPNEKARTTEETIDHIFGLSNVILNAMQKKVNGISGEETSALKFEDKRSRTLENLKMASEIQKNSKSNIEEYKIIFKNGDKTTEYPFWNLINGPIEDAVWHIGQVVSFRRSSGNPFNSKASVLTGKVRK
jgi:hypothetical protein